jgi:hypothetical protein
LGSDGTAMERAKAVRARSPWLVLDTVYDSWTGDMLFVQAVLAADDPAFRFHDPCDYPRLPPSVVEAANKRYRKAHRVYERTMLSYDPTYWNAIFRNERLALRRMANHRPCPWDHGGVLVPGNGGYICGDLPTRSGDCQIDWWGEMIVDLFHLRQKREYEAADALRRDILATCNLEMFMFRDGIEFINSE